MSIFPSNMALKLIIKNPAYLKYNKKLRLNIIDIDNNNFLYNVLVIFSISIATLYQR